MIQTVKPWGGGYSTTFLNGGTAPKSNPAPLSGKASPQRPLEGISPEWRRSMGSSHPREGVLCNFSTGRLCPEVYPHTPFRQCLPNPIGAIRGNIPGGKEKYRVITHWGGGTLQILLQGGSAPNSNPVPLSGKAFP